MRKLLKFGIFAASVAGIAKMASNLKAEWQGLTESEVRAKLHTKLDSKVPADKVDEMADKIVEGMRDKGVLGEEAAGDVTAETGAPADQP